MGIPLRVLPRIVQTFFVLANPPLSYLPSTKALEDLDSIIQCKLLLHSLFSKIFYFKKISILYSIGLIFYAIILHWQNWHTLVVNEPQLSLWSRKQLNTQNNYGSTHVVTCQRIVWTKIDSMVSYVASDFNRFDDVWEELQHSLTSLISLITS